MYTGKRKTLESMMHLYVGCDVSAVSCCGISSRSHAGFLSPVTWKSNDTTLSFQADSTDSLNRTRCYNLLKYFCKKCSVNNYTAPSMAYVYFKPHLFLQLEKKCNLPCYVKLFVHGSTKLKQIFKITLICVNIF